MKTTLSERDGNTVKLAVEVSSEELQEAFDSRLRQLSREARLPGFRPGKAPAAMVRRRLGDETILIDAVEERMSGWFTRAMAELGLEAVDRPQIDLEDELPSLDRPLGFKATVTVMPEVLLGDYKGLKVPKEPVVVEDSEVDSQMDRLRNEFAELRPVTGRGVQKGDFVAADLRAIHEGKPVEALEASDYVFEVGGEQILPEIEEQVVGMGVDEEKTFPVVLPQSLPDDLGGKTVEFTVKVKDIKEKELPPLTDKWASEISEFPTLLELRQEIRSRIQAAKEHISQQGFISAALQLAVDNAEVDLPEVMVHSQAEDMLADLKRSLESRGGRFEDYLEAAGTTAEKMLEDMRPRAANTVKTGLVLDAIAKAEGLEATDEEVAALIAQMAAATKTDAKALENRLRKNGGIEPIREQILRDKALDFVAKSAVPQAPEPIKFEVPESVKAALAAETPAAETPAAETPAAEGAAAEDAAAARPAAEAEPVEPASEEAAAAAGAEAAEGGRAAETDQLASGGGR